MAGGGAAENLGGLFGGALGMGAGIYGMMQADKVRDQQRELLNKQKALYYNFQLPTMQKKATTTFGQFRAQTAMSGAAVNAFGAQAGQAQEAQDLSNTLNLQNQQQQISFQSQENQINNQYAQNMFQGASAIAGGVIGMGSGAGGFI